MGQKAAHGRADRELLTSQPTTRPKSSSHPPLCQRAGCAQGAGTRGTCHVRYLQGLRGDAMNNSQMTTCRLPDKFKAPKEGLHDNKWHVSWGFRKQITLRRAVRLRG